MNIYQHLLIAVDLHHNYDAAIVQRGIAIAQTNNAKISIIHAVEHMNSYGFAEVYSAVIDVETQLMDEARKELTQLAEKFNIPATQQFLEVGAPKVVILDKAASLKADLIVLGSHGRHGLQLLLGSTANAVLHNANCDVLAVRVKDES